MMKCASASGTSYRALQLLRQESFAAPCESGASFYGIFYEWENRTAVRGAKRESIFVVSVAWGLSCPTMYLSGLRARGKSHATNGSRGQALPRVAYPSTSASTPSLHGRSRQRRTSQLSAASASGTRRAFSLENLKRLPAWLRLSSRKSSNGVEGNHASLFWLQRDGRVRCLGSLGAFRHLPVVVGDFYSTGHGRGRWPDKHRLWSAPVAGSIGKEFIVFASEPRPSCCSGGDHRVGAIQVQEFGARTWEQRRALRNGDSLVLQPTLTGRGPCDSGASNSSFRVSGTSNKTFSPAPIERAVA